MVYELNMGIIIPIIVFMGICCIIAVIFMVKEAYGYEHWKEMPVHRLYYKITKKRRMKKGGLKYICYNPKKDLFFCKNCLGILSRGDYDVTETENYICSYCGQRLTRIFWI